MHGHVGGQWVAQQAQKQVLAHQSMMRKAKPPKNETSPGLETLSCGSWS